MKIKNKFKLGLSLIPTIILPIIMVACSPNNSTNNQDNPNVNPDTNPDVKPNPNPDVNPGDQTQNLTGTIESLNSFVPKEEYKNKILPSKYDSLSSLTNVEKQEVLVAIYDLLNDSSVNNDFLLEYLLLSFKLSLVSQSSINFTKYNYTINSYSVVIIGNQIKLNFNYNTDVTFTDNTGKEYNMVSNSLADNEIVIRTDYQEETTETSRVLPSLKYSYNIGPVPGTSDSYEPTEGDFVNIWAFYFVNI